MIPVPMTAESLQACWNQAAAGSGLPKCLAITGPRKRHIAARLKDNDDPAWWEAVIRKIHASAFCRGEVTHWRATFDFLIRPDTALKVMEGQYDTVAPKRPTTQDHVMATTAQLAERYQYLKAQS